MAVSPSAVCEGSEMGRSRGKPRVLAPRSSSISQDPGRVNGLCLGCEATSVPRSLLSSSEAQASSLHPYASLGKEIFRGSVYR